MPFTCVTCGEPIEESDYRLVGVERGTWESRYAHRGSCEAEIRERYAPAPRKKKRRKKKRSADAPPVEELTLDDPDPFPGDDDLPWSSMGRR